MTGERAVAWHQKLGLALLVTIALATFVLGFVRLRKAVAQPFQPKTGITFRSAEEIENERQEKLKTQDTDSDGLTDYDELYVFRTSPFLEDSDSDGFGDGQEVATSSDPNCPKGKQCRQAALGTSSGSQPSGSGIDTGTNASAPAPTGSEEQIYDAIIRTFGDPTKLTAAQITAKLDAMSSAELRSFLTTMGVPESALAKADDATLKKLLGDTLIEIAGAGGGGLGE